MPIIHGIESRYSEYDYLSVQPFLDECEVRCQTTKIVKTKKEHKCSWCKDPHMISAGSLAYCERAVVDGKWMSSYCCIESLDSWLEEIMD